MRTMRGRNVRTFRGADTASAGPALNTGNELIWVADSGVTGSPVSAWVDTSQGVSASQGTPANRPAFTASNANFNGEPTIDFTGASTHTLVTGTGTATMTGDAGAVLTVVRFTASVASFDYLFQSTGAHNRVVTITSADKIVTRMNPGSLLTSTNTFLNTTLAIEHVYTGTESRLYVNGALEASNLSDTAFADPDNGSFRVVIGATNTLSFPVTCQLAELRILSYEYGSANQTAWRSEVSTKYGITFS